MTHIHTMSQEFLQFLKAAKAATYAAEGNAAQVRPVLEDSRQLEFRQGSYVYRDIYVGSAHFVGQEVVYDNDKALWSLAYSGGILAGVAMQDAPSIYALLRQALQVPLADLPLRGPALMEAAGMRYSCTVHGALQRFHGREIITRLGEPVYELHFSGGQLA